MIFKKKKLVSVCMWGNRDWLRKREGEAGYLDGGIDRKEGVGVRTWAGDGVEDFFVHERPIEEAWWC